MRRLAVFNNLSLDGYIADASGSMSWATREDDEWREYMTGNATGPGPLLFGRVTYDLMVSFWPTPQAAAAFPEAAAGMNRREKLVFSRTLDRAAWNNTTVIRDDIARAVRAMKQSPGEDMLILGSGSIAAQLARQRLIDEFQILMNPVILGAGKSMFAGVAEKLKLTKSRIFQNGSVLLHYEPVTR